MERLLGQRDTATAPFQQRGAGLPLQLGDLLRDRRRGVAERGGGTRDGAVDEDGVQAVLPLLGLSLLFEGWDRDKAALAALDWSGAGIIVYVAWITTVFGFGAWGFLLRHYPASSVAPFTLLVPVFGMSSAALLLGESVSPLRWCAAALLVGGVALTSLAGARRPRAGAQEALEAPKPEVARAA